MKGKIKLIVLSICISGCFTGCGNVIADMTENESEQISEYAAAVLLAYDKDYHGRLLNEEEMAKAEEEEAIAQARAEEVRRIAERSKKEKEQAENEMDGSDSAKGNEGQADVKEEIKLADFLGLSGFDVQYDGMSVEDAYPSGTMDLTDDASAFFSMKAPEGNKLLVVKLRVTNTSAQDQVLDLLSKNVHFTISGDAIVTSNTLVTMLEDDFSVYSGNVAAGASIQTVLIAQIKAEQADAVSKLSLGVKYNDASATIALQ